MPLGGVGPVDESLAVIGHQPDQGDQGRSGKEFLPEDPACRESENARHRDRVRTNPVYREKAKARCLDLQQARMQDPMPRAQLLRTFARRFEGGALDGACSILEGLDEILTLGRTAGLGQSRASTTVIASMHNVVRQTCRTGKRWYHAKMELRWTQAGRLETRIDFRCRSADQQLPLLDEVLVCHRQHRHLDSVGSGRRDSITGGTALVRFNIKWNIPLRNPGKAGGAASID